MQQNTLDGPVQLSGGIKAQPSRSLPNTAAVMGHRAHDCAADRAPEHATVGPASAAQPRTGADDAAAAAAAASVAAAMAAVTDAGVAPTALGNTHGGGANTAARRAPVVVDPARTPAAARLRPDVRVIRRSVYDSTVPSREELEQMTFMQKVQSVYHRPISEAAQVLDMGVTVLKKQCRNQGISRWPFRKLQSIDKLIQSVQMVCLSH